MKEEIIAKTTRVFNNVKLQTKKYSPEILMVVGITGTVVSTVIACKQTLKVNEILEEKRDTIEKIHTCLESDEIEYDQKEANKDLTITYTQTGVKLFKLYAPSIILGSLSISSIVAGHRILRKRNIAIAAAYAIMDKSFKKYRSNVIEEYGEGVDQAMRLGIKSKEVKTKDKNGKTKTKKEQYIDPNNGLDEYSDYARFFDATSASFTKDPEYNLMFLRRQQDYANEILKSRGHLFLNEVYDLLDIPRTKAGQVVGWIYDPKNNKQGDNYVDFGIYKDSESHRRFVNGLEYNILLDFNVDGIIYYLI